MGHPIHKHMHTHITKQNVKSAIKDDKAHMDYLKRDVKDDQRAGGKYKDINQTADEKHISKLAGDVKYDEKKEGMSRYEKEKGMSRKASPLNDFKGGYHKVQHAKGEAHKSPASNITYGDKSGPTGYIGEEKKDLMKYNPVDDRAGVSRHVSTHDGSGGHTITKKMGKKKPKWKIESEKKFQAKKDSITAEKARLLKITKERARKRKLYGSENKAPKENK